MVIRIREEENAVLDEVLSSARPEFLAVRGRRRVGKTFLIREFFKEKDLIFFNSTGSKNAPLAAQIKHFIKVLGDVFYNGASLEIPKNWDDTFEMLTTAIKNVEKTKKIVLFFDELPWMATPKSRLLENLDYYWNQYWSQDNRIKLIVCGSSASWIINKIINNRGGLHNRVTRQILLEPLNLYETKRFLSKHGVKLNHDQILQVYMATGGVPYYLSFVKKGLSAAQIIEELAFTKKAPLIDEFDNLFSSLFDNYELSVEIIRTIASRRYGIGQEELFKKLNRNLKGKLGLSKLDELEKAGFIMSFIPYQSKKKGKYFRVIDEYILFYLKWIEPIKNALTRGGLSKEFWESQQNTPSWRSWSGLAFESICYKHISQIRRAMNLGPSALPYTWRYVPKKGSTEDGAQIDLLFERGDNAITIFEIKHSLEAFLIDKPYAKSLNEKIKIFSKKTKTEKQIFLSIMASNGIKKNMYSEEFITGCVALSDLFVKT